MKVEYPTCMVSWPCPDDSEPHLCVRREGHGGRHVCGCDAWVITERFGPLSSDGTPDG